MRVGQALLDIAGQAQRLLDRRQLDRVEVRPEDVGPVIQERRYRDTFSDGRSTVDNFLFSDRFKQQYNATLAGETQAAERVQEVKKKYEPYFAADSFTPAQQNLVTFKAADLQRLHIAA